MFQVQGLKLDDFARGKLGITMKELLEEKEEAMAVCNADWLDDSKLWISDWDAFLDDWLSIDPTAFIWSFEKSYFLFV